MSNTEDLDSLVSLIDNLDVKRFTNAVLKVAPGVFWTAKASRNHHPLDERAQEGNLLHTIRVTKLVRIMAEGCSIDQIDADVLTSAAILHDVCRYGLTGDAEFTTSNHPKLVRGLAHDNNIRCKYSVDIFTLIERHMGKWGEDRYEPEITPSTMLHMADMVSANAGQVWGKEELPIMSWVGEIPFEEIGMTEDKMQLLKELAEDSNYWKSSLHFIGQVSSRKLSTLTDRQRNWLSDIVASLGDELNKRDAKEAFTDDPNPPTNKDVKKVMRPKE